MGVMSAASMEARFWFSPSRGRMTWREPSELIFPLTGPNDWCPLVVIDAEDREQAERLEASVARLMGWHTDDNNPGVQQRRDAFQAALREFANPVVKPEEPTGLGAVVEAINDNHFVRIGSGGWVHSDDKHGNVCDWDDIAVVRVLSEGVTA